MFKIDLKDIAIQILNNWFSVRKSMYFIVIKDVFFCQKNNKIMIKYQCANKRIGDVISIIDFMESPLKHATHPDQIFYIGVQMERLLNKINKMPHSNPEIKKQLNRFKKVFYQEDGKR